MTGRFTLEHSRDGVAYVGRLVEVPVAFRHGETLDELRENTQDAYDLMVIQGREPAPAGGIREPLEVRGVKRRDLVREFEQDGFGGRRFRRWQMPDYLIGFSYHEPEPYALWQRGVVEDFESSDGLWVTAGTPAEAIAWGERVAEALHRRVNDPAADWSGAGHFAWLEESPATSSWAHCLDFFQRVRAGEMPPLDRMGTEAYRRWQERRLAERGAAPDPPGFSSG